MTSTILINKFLLQKKIRYESGIPWPDESLYQCANKKKIFPYIIIVFEISFIDHICEHFKIHPNN